MNDAHNAAIGLKRKALIKYPQQMSIVGGVVPD